MPYKEHFVKSADIAVESFDSESKVGAISANFGQHFGFKIVGVHHVVVPPGFRISKPHAESTEEEFVFVMKGEIDLWFNGRIKTMVMGDSIGFPAGTGVGHTFINNSKADVELFVAGDRTRDDNKCGFHLEPELKAELGDFWWESMPAQELGGHDGLPGPYDVSLVDETIEVLNGFVDIPKASFSYTGSTETFSDGRCLSREFGLKSIAVWIEKISPSKRTSWPHAHSLAEEFVFVIKGEISVWLDGEIIKADPMTAIDFKAGSGVAHTLMNQFDEDVYYLCVGECDPVGDKIFYPLHPERNEEVKATGRLWEDSGKSASI